jgi:hypothetical protein
MGGRGPRHCATSVRTPTSSRPAVGAIALYASRGYRLLDAFAIS